MTWVRRPPIEATADPDAPRKVADLPDFWDRRRLLEGKPDTSRCAADLRQALEALSTWGDEE